MERMIIAGAAPIIGLVASMALMPVFLSMSAEAAAATSPGIVGLGTSAFLWGLGVIATVLPAGAGAAVFLAAMRG